MSAIPSCAPPKKGDEKRDLSFDFFPLRDLAGFEGGNTSLMREDDEAVGSVGEGDRGWLSFGEEGSYIFRVSCLSAKAAKPDEHVTALITLATA